MDRFRCETWNLRPYFILCKDHYRSPPNSPVLNLHSYFHFIHYLDPSLSTTVDSNMRLILSKGPTHTNKMWVRECVSYTIVSSLSVTEKFRGVDTQDLKGQSTRGSIGPYKILHK